MADPELIRQLERSRALGFLGPVPVEDHIAHARGFLEVVGEPDGVVIDLGSGGGVPGLVVAVARPDLAMVLLDATAKRCRFLEEAVRALDLAARVRVVESRAESAGRGPLRGTASVVVARSFGAPSPTAECAAPLLAVGGRLIVSEPPQPEDRWPPDALRALGLVPRERAGSPAVQVLEQVAPCPAIYPRRDGIPAKRPLF